MQQDIHAQEQWVTQTEIAALKGGLSLQLLYYYLKRPTAPQPVTMYGKKLYKRSEVEAWEL